jgi:hypothetical protein
MTTPSSVPLGRRISERLGELTLEKVSALGFANAKANMPAIAGDKSVMALRETPLAAASDALVLAAGPSMHRQDIGALIKASGFGGTLIATDSALAWCLRQSIVPDLVVTLDPHADRIVRWFGDPGLDAAAIERDDYFSRQDMDPRFRQDQLAFNRELVGLVNAYGGRIRVAVSSSVSPAVVQRLRAAGMDAYWWNPMYDDDDIEDGLTRQIHRLNGLPCINAGGNVGTACWVFAHAVLGKRRVGLLGMDFGYYADTPYESTQYYREIVDLVGHGRLNEVFVRIHNPHVNAEFYTDPAYLWFRSVFLQMIDAADCETVNCTGGGILFGPGIQWSSLTDFFDKAR